MLFIILTYLSLILHEDTEFFLIHCQIVYFTDQILLFNTFIKIENINNIMLTIKI